MSLDLTVLYGALFIFLARVSDVSLGTIRTILITQGKKYLAAAIGAIEVFIFITAVSSVLKQGLDNPWNVLGYCAGFATGNIVGVTVENMLALGHAQVSIVSRTASQTILAALHQAGLGATIIPGEGLKGSVAVILTLVKRRQVPAVRELTAAADPDAFIIVNPAPQFYQGTVLRGFTHAGRK